MGTRLEAWKVEILLVEDNWGDVVLLREAFQDCGLPVELSVVTDGEKALEILRRGEGTGPALVLLDLNLPRMDGRSFLRRLKEEGKAEGPPVVVLSSSKLTSDIRESLDLRARDYLVKPVDLAGFRETARRVWAEWLDPSIRRARGEGEDAGEGMDPWEQGGEE